MSVASNSLQKSLQKRAEFLKKARSFFDSRGLVEVDCSHISNLPSIDAHIDLFEVISSIHPKRFLISSPEYAMKKLLSKGSQDLYFLGHVFRDESCGRIHSFEFLMAEWYRKGFSFKEMIDETVEFISEFVGKRPICMISYEEAFLRYTGIDPFQEEAIIQNFVKTFPEIPEKILLSSDKDDLLNFMLTLRIEPLFDPKAITVLYHYPSSQAALSQKVKDKKGNPVAERFEIYCEGMELANGYHELSDPVEQRYRFTEENRIRERLNKQSYPIDEEFLAALSTLPDCSGVAVGMDRVFMITPPLEDQIPQKKPW